MENKLEQLLNMLIQRGWEPMGNRPITQLKKNVKVERYHKKPVAVVIKNGRGYADDYYSLRDIISKESGLWQFVCEMSAYNNYNKEKGKVFTWKKFEDDKYRINGYSNGGGFIQDYEYRLIESALKDESELESFILDNIKV